MEKFKKLKNMPAKVKKRLTSALLLLCTMATFAAPAFGGGFSAVKPSSITSSAAAVEDIDLVLVAASAFGEAKKAMNATDLDKQQTFIDNTEKIVGGKWQNIGLLIGARDGLSGTALGTYQSPLTLSKEELETYGSQSLIDAYVKYKAFGYAVQNLNEKAQKSHGAAASTEEGLNAMSAAAVKMGGFGVSFLNKYNPGPLLISLYDSRQMNNYPDNEWIKFVRQHAVLNEIVHTFGDQVPGTGMSFFLIFGAVIAIAGLGVSMLFVLLGNRTIGDAFKKFILRAVISALGIYLIGNALSLSLKWLDGTIQDMARSPSSEYTKDNLNLYDWYLTGFQLPSGVTIEIGIDGNFKLKQSDVEAINKMTYERVHGETATAENMKAQMETYAQNGNSGMASFITPIYNSNEGGDGWNTDKYYAYMGVYAQNIDLGSPDDFNVDTESPIYDQPFSIYKSKYTYMSNLQMTKNGTSWNVNGGTANKNFYGINPISALNMMRSDFSGGSIAATSTVYPSIGYVAFDISVPDPAGTGTPADRNMNALSWFIATFTLTLAALKGFFTIITSGFAGLISGGVRTSSGSAGGLGQALGAVIALVGGILGISILMSITLSLLDVVYGVATDLVGSVDAVEAFLQPMLEALRDVPIIGPFFGGVLKTITHAFMTVLLALTFPKMGSIPINMFVQWVSDIPGHLSEKAMMLENMLMSNRGSAGMGGLGGGHRPSGQYTKQAQGMANRAFSSGARQAFGVMRAGSMVAASLAGAGLAAGGRALNKKADAMEGSNGSGNPVTDPGMPGFDEMTPEQQEQVAALAEQMGDETWNGMSDDQKREAAKNAGIFDNNDAHENGKTTDRDGTPEPLEPDGTEEIASEKAVDTSADTSGGPTEGELPEEKNVREAGQKQSIAALAAAAASSDGQAAQGDQKRTDGQPAEQVPSDKVPDQSASMAQDTAKAQGAKDEQETKAGITGVDTPGSGQEPKPSAETANGQPQAVSGDQSLGGGSTRATNVNNVSTVQEGQSLEAKTNMISNADIQEVDASRETVSETVTEQSELGTPPAAEGSQGVSTTAEGAPQGARSLSETGAVGRESAAAEGDTIVQSAASTAHEQHQDTKLNNNISQHAQINNSGQGAGGGTPPATPAGQAQSQEERKTPRTTPAKKNNESMNAAPKQDAASIKQQKRVRALHAAGDALQMMGGNRTMKDGIKDAFYHAGEGFSYMMPDELQPFTQNLRMRRMERNQRAMLRQNRKDQKNGR